MERIQIEKQQSDKLQNHARLNDMDGNFLSKNSGGSKLISEEGRVYKKFTASYGATVSNSN